jgi:hypothetical protein
LNAGRISRNPTIKRKKPHNKKFLKSKKKAIIKASHFSIRRFLRVGGLGVKLKFVYVKKHLYLV